MRTVRWARVAAVAFVVLTACTSTVPTGSGSTKVRFTGEEGFSAVFPIKPKRSTHTETAAGVTVKIAAYQAKTKTEEVAIGVSEFPDAVRGPALQASLDGAIDGAASNVKGRVVERARVLYLGNPAEDGTITTSGGFVRLKVVSIGKLLYILETVTKSSTVAHPAYDELVSTFNPG